MHQVIALYRDNAAYKSLRMAVNEKDEMCSNQHITFVAHVPDATCSFEVFIC